MIRRRKFVNAAIHGLLAASAGSLVAGKSYAAGEQILLRSVQPRTVGRGTRNTYSFQLVDSAGRPISGKLVRVWFTGAPNAVSAGYQMTTNANGYATYTMNSPNFRGSNWLNINAECRALGVPPRAWRVGY